MANLRDSGGRGCMSSWCSCSEYPSSWNAGCVYEATKVSILQAYYGREETKSSKERREERTVRQEVEAGLLDDK